MGIVAARGEASDATVVCARPRDRWDADALRDMVREYVIEHLADDDAVLVVDETGFLKQGKSSCGVARQYTGSAGKITNCQIGVFAAYVSRHGHAFVDRALYVPKSWTDDPARLKATYVPDNVIFATKPQLAAQMIDRAIATSVPFRWVAGDTVYGVGDIERDLRQAGKGYVLGVEASRVFRSWGKRRIIAGTAAEIAKALGASEWDACQLGREPRGPAYMTGIMWNWPISKQAISMRRTMACGRAAC